MKLKKLTSALMALGFLTGGYATSLLAATPYSTAITPGPEESTAEVKFGYLSDDGVKLGRYTGPTGDGAKATLNLDLRYKDKENDGRYSHTQIKGLGSDTVHFRHRTGEQGNYSLGVEYREKVLFQERGLQTPISGNHHLLLPDLNSGQTLATAPTSNININHKRESFRITGQKVLEEAWKLNFVINREDKSGNRIQGFGFWTGQAGIQMPAPIDQRTDQLDFSLEYQGDKLQARVGYHLSKFTQLDDNHFQLANPQAIAPADSRFAETQKFSLAPDNEYHRITGSMAYALSNATRFSGELDLGRAIQDASFVQDTSYQDNLDKLGIDSLDAKYDTTRLGLRASHRLNPGTMLRASYRLDDRDNKTAIHKQLEGDASFSNIKLRDTRIHSWTRHTADADANIRLPLRSNLLVGAKYEDTDRKTGARGETQEATLHARIRSKVTNSLTSGFKASYADLSGSTYDDTVTANSQLMRKYHLASVEKTLLSANANWHALDQLALGLEVTYKDFDYTKSEAGLQEDQRLATTLTADYFPSRNLSGYAFFTYEDGERTQAGTSQQLTHEITTLSLGLGGKYKISDDSPFSLGADLLVVNSETDIKANLGTDFTTLESNLTELRLYGDYQYSKNLTFKLAYLAHKYEDKDWANDPITSPGYTTMGVSNYDETVHLVVGSAAYRF